MERMLARDARNGSPVIYKRIFTSIENETSFGHKSGGLGESFKDDTSSCYSVNDSDIIQLDGFKLFCLRINMLNGVVEGN